MLNQLDKQPAASNDNTNVVNGPVTNNPTHEHSTLNTDMDNNLEKVKKIINIISVKKQITKQKH